jgi:hypothetical protein
MPAAINRSSAVVPDARSAILIHGHGTWFGDDSE